MEKFKLKFYIWLCKTYLKMAKKLEESYEKDPRVIIDFNLIWNKIKYKNYLEYFQEELQKLEKAEK